MKEVRMTIIKAIEKQLNIQIHEPQLIHTAFSHSSFVNEQKRQQIENNERLEFLGDAVLEMITSHYLYHYYREQPEGFLSRMRATLVREESLAFLARQNHFDQYIKLGHGEEANGGRLRNSILADCFEAFLGALYLDQGYEVVEKFLMDQLLNNHKTLVTDDKHDYKTELQERLQQQGTIKIQYRLVSQEGPAHNQMFESGLYVKDQLITTGRGKTKKLSEQQAAKKAFAFVDEKGNLHVSK
ncbi:ribonuclease III [Aerococcaceae bacterium DSM 111020]|nr:ribonuclease III [Aerococcaceae bacterium DSM 111020]